MFNTCMYLSNKRDQVWNITNYRYIINHKLAHAVSWNCL